MFASKKLCIELSCLEKAFDFCTGFGIRSLLDNLTFISVLLHPIFAIDVSKPFYIWFPERLFFTLKGDAFVIEDLQDQLEMHVMLFAFKVFSLILPPVLNTCLSDLGCDCIMDKLC